MTATAKNVPTTSAVEPAKVVADIIQNQMGLTSKQIAMAYQDYSIPSEGVFVVLGYLGPTETISCQSSFDPAQNAEVQEVSVRHTIQIEIMSMAPDNSARIRKEEILLALTSFYSLQQQVKNLVGIAWQASDLVDASAQEETTMLNRYVTTIAVNALHRKVIPAGSFTKFPIQLTADSEGGRATTAEIDPATPAT